MDIIQCNALFMLEAVNVGQMVEDKVNTLPVLKVEEVLLGIMREHLLYINLFGALLGFLIGLLNLFLSPP